jgi:hypothetical protein
MSDLISRKAVMNYLREQQANVIIEQSKENYVTYEATKGMLSSVDAFMNFIVQLPAAYDVDKVVEQLQQMKARYFLTIANTGNETLDKIYEEVGNSIDKATEIVKEGAVKDE